MKSVLEVLFLLYFMIISTGTGLAHATETVYTNSIGMEFVLIPAGKFFMGSDDSDMEAGEDEKPRHQVIISKPFYLSKYEVTQEQWERLMGKNPYSLARTYGSRWDSLLEKPGRFKGPKNPATVSWNDAQAFITKLNALEGHGRYRRLPKLNGSMPPEPVQRPGTALEMMPERWGAMRGTEKISRMVRRIRLGKRNRMPGACMICMEMFGNGYRIGTTPGTT